MDFPSFTQLYHAQDILRSEKKNIIDEWISQNSVPLF